MKLPTFAHTIYLAALFSIPALSLVGFEAEPTPTPAPTVAQRLTSKAALCGRRKRSPVV